MENVKEAFHLVSQSLILAIIEIYECMSWDKEWNAIESNIIDVDRLCSNTIDIKLVKSFDSLGTVRKIVFPACKTLLDRIVIYKSRYSLILPEQAIQAIDCSIEQLANKFVEVTATACEPASLLFYKEIFNRLRFDFNYFVSELEGSIYRKSERAFLHLQRILAVNDEDRNRWKEAFNHETHIEALGAVHLLSHGIWAFKVDSAGQRTDLVFQEEFTSNTYKSIRVASEGLVLTEWKLVKNVNDAPVKAQEAFKQASIYSAESLAETELTKYRYLVLVSLKKIDDMPDDFDLNGVKYRHINLAIEIESPSVRSRRK